MGFNTQTHCSDPLVDTWERGRDYMRVGAEQHTHRSLRRFADDTTANGLIQDWYESAYRGKVDQLVLWCTKQEPGIFVLRITRTKQSDTAFYYCLKSQNYNISFLTGIFLRVKVPEPDISAVIQNLSTEAVLPGDSVALQCSVFSGSEQKTCPEQHSVYWFRVKPDESYPSLIYTQGNRDEECEKSPDTRPLQSCVYSFFKDNVSYSDTGTYYCALAACGKVVFGNGTKLNIKGNSIFLLYIMDNVILYLLFAALALSLIVIAFLVCAIRKTSCNCCKGKSYSHIHLFKCVSPKATFI
ncbi:uncharacterized protein LOC125008534 [Mugil cephalus]|uniref:uncharacterized protein LOC125008534 n=1 Tax=Mugil cephalus TaxID=48193 RepID=UPI001FB7E143|nr:uncharacterized protein LOC125008534 [Mugil cephalus]